MKRIVSGLLAVFAAMSIGVTASAASARYPDPNGQNKDNWCWAASAKIVAENNGGINTSIDHNQQLLRDINTIGLRDPFYGYYKDGTSTEYYADGVQYAIVKYIYGTDDDLIGDDEVIVRALQYASAKDMNVGWKGCYMDELSSDMINEINNDLMNGKYIIGSMTNKNYKFAHSVVIKSYSSSSDSYVVFNPWDGTERAVSANKLFHSYGYQYSQYQYGRVSWFKYCR